MAGRASRTALALACLLAVAGCGGPAATTTPTPAPASTGTSSSTPSSASSPSPPAIARCGVTPDAHPSATIKVTKDSVGVFDYSAPVTIKAGQAVIFSNGNFAPQAVREGTGGIAAADACVDASLAENSSVIVTFWQKGTYEITSDQYWPEVQTSVVVK